MHVAASALLIMAPLSSMASPLWKRLSDLKGSAVHMHMPPARLWDDSTDSHQPCGGIAFNGTRTQYPLSGGNISITVRADADRLGFNYATVENPSRNSEFSLLTHEQSGTVFRGHHCLDMPDFGALGFSAGQKLTIQATWIAGTADTRLYECSDIELVDPANYVAPAGAMCFTGALDTATVDMNNYSDPAPSSGGMSKGAKAGAAVGAIIGGLLVIGAIAYFVVKKRRNQKAPSAEHANLPSYHDTHGTTVGTGGPAMVEKSAQN